MGTSGDYRFDEIEAKWQKHWADQNTFATEDEDSSKPKYYILDMLPYPSGSGLHVGHVEGYTATDIISRYKRMCGFNVLHPMGWDAFGLPAEQYAIKTGQHPEVTTKNNVKNFKEQFYRIGFSTDWSREVDTTDPEFYKWTQWIFQQLYKKGLAYESYAPVNWCPELGTVLANEEVIDGKSEVGGFPVEKKPLRQWVLKITEYADRLIDDLDDIDWPESTKEMQRNWIGRSVGAEINFKVDGHNDLSFDVFSTRADTLYGATFCVLAPEHPLISKIVTHDQKDQIEDYLEETKDKSELLRMDTKREKTGVATGAYAVNPVSGEKLPIFVADYVLVSYGTGAIMAVPGHDERDHAFAKKYELTINKVLESSSGESADINEEAFLDDDGVLVNSDFLNGLGKIEALEKMHDHLEANSLGKRKVTYRLRDWIFSRQRYWGEPFPLAHDEEGNIHLVDEKDLPVTLPKMSDYKPSKTGEPPLSKATEWTDVELNGKVCKRETNIMPQWAGSCWYYLRYIDALNKIEPWAKSKEKYWLPVDLYVGGVEHANLHLLYARFWHKVLFDLGFVSTKEPFQRLVHPGIILGPNGEKMSKSRGNVVNPIDVIDEWGADSLRLYEMFLGPIDQPKPWQTKGISGVHRFLKRVWRLAVDESGELSSKLVEKEEEIDTKKLLHKTIKKVTEDTENLSFNTAIASMMEFLNHCYKKKTLSFETIRSFVLTLAPYAPHLCEELWEKLGAKVSLSDYTWPSFDDSLVKEDTVRLCVMFNGKARGAVEISKGSTEKEVKELVLQDGKLASYLADKEPKKVIYVPGKIINFVL